MIRPKTESSLLAATSAVPKKKIPVQGTVYSPIVLLDPLPASWIMRSPTHGCADRLQSLIAFHVSIHSSEGAVRYTPMPAFMQSGFLTKSHLITNFKEEQQIHHATTNL